MNLSKEKIVIIGGAGHVGIPLGLALASKGFDVTLLDKNQTSTDMINRGELPFVETGGERILRDHIGKNLRAVNDSRYIKEADVVFFVVGTPIDEHLNPKVRDMISVFEEYRTYLSDDQLLIMRSTLFPGTLRIIQNHMEHSGLKCRLAFCPERILQGKGIEEIFELPQIVSGITEEAVLAAEKLFLQLTSQVIRATPEEAELAKLMVNSWRYLNFAIANQFYMMASDSGVDFNRVYDAMTAGYPRAKFFAKPGLTAGPCLYKDTMQLAAFYHNNFFLGHAAMLVNEGLPDHLIRTLKQKLNGSLCGKKIGILGMTFKANNDDTRESLSFKLKKLLEIEMAEVIESDPYLKDSVPLEKALETADGIILGAPHDEYLGLQIEIPFVDCWGILNKENRQDERK